MNKKLNLILRSIHHYGPSAELILGDDIMIHKTLCLYHRSKSQVSFTITKLYEDLFTKNNEDVDSFGNKILSYIVYDNDCNNLLCDVKKDYCLTCDEVEPILLELFDKEKFNYGEKVQDYSNDYKPTSNFTIYLDDWLELIKYSDNTIIVHVR
jgi:hypothetical protein